MRRAWLAFRAGISRMLRYWQVILLLYLANLVSAGLLLLLPGLSLLGPAHLTAMRAAAAGIPSWMAIDIFSLFELNRWLDPAAPASLPAGLQTGLLLALLVVVLFPWLVGLPATFLTGGTLLTYRESPQVFRLRRFWWGCWRWWGAFILMALLEFLGSLLALVIILAAAARLSLSLGGWLWWLVLVLLLWIMATGLALLEIMRVFLVVGDTRDLRQGFRQAVVFLWRNPKTLASYYLLSLSALLAAHIVFVIGLFPRLPLWIWPVVLLSQQAFIALRLSLRLVRYAGGISLVAAG